MEIEVFYSQRKGANKVWVKGMDDFLDVDAEPFDGSDSDDDNAGDGATRVGDIPMATDGDDAHIRSPSPKRRMTLRGKTVRKRKKSVERTRPTMIIPEEVAVQFATDLLWSTLPMTPAEEDVLVEPSNVVGAPDLPTSSSP